MIVQDKIESDLKSIGINEGMVLALHSSLSSLGQVDGGADTVVKAFLSVLGESGTLMVPAFTYSFADLSFATKEPFDYKKTKSRVGIITESVRNYPGSIRSFHPTHSVAAIGKLSNELTKDHLASSPLGIDSPFHRLAKLGGYIMLLGVDHRASSLIHTSEILAELPYINITFTPDRDYEKAIIVREGKKVAEIKIYESPGCSRGFGKAEKVLDSAGLIKRGKIGEADAQIFPVNDSLECLVSHLKKDPSAFLCDIEDCNICTRRKEHLMWGQSIHKEQLF